MKYIFTLFWILVFCVLFAFLQVQYAFNFYFIEQRQLFQNTWYYISEVFFQPGGLSLILSEFIVQFYLLPYWGAAITAGLISIAGILTYRIINVIAPRANLLVLSLLPVISLLFIQFDFNYITQGTVSYVLMLVAFLLVILIKSYKSRLIVHGIVTFILFYLAGPVFVLYALSATLYEFFKKSPHKYLAFIILAEAFIIGFGSIYFSVTPDFRFTFLPDAFYHTRRFPPFVIYFSWISLLLLVGLAIAVRNKDIVGKNQYLSWGLQSIIIVAFTLWGIPRYDDAKSYMIKKLDYYCRTGQWDNILECCKGPLNNYLYLNCVNMALSEKEELGEKIFSYDQRGTRGILVTWNRTDAISVLLSDLYFAINNIAPSQELAFEAYVATTNSGNPRMLKRLVQTNLIYGDYPIAEKYISILENTHCYKDWAKAHRKFLYKDELIENDELLGKKRRSLVTKNTLSQMKGLDADLCQIAEINPSAPAAIEFLGSSYLLAKDVLSFQLLIEKYYGTEVIPVLPKSFQEAVIILSETDPEYWKRFHISESIIQRFDEYKKQVVANKNNTSLLPGLLRSSFGDTYWYYFMFK